LFARYAYKDGAQDVRFVLVRADIDKDNAKGTQKYFFPTSVQAGDHGFDIQWQWRGASDAEIKRYKTKASAQATTQGEDGNDADAESSATEGTTLQERVLAAWRAGADFKGAKLHKALNPILLATNARRYVRKNTSDFFVHPPLQPERLKRRSPLTKVRGVNRHTLRPPTGPMQRRIRKTFLILHHATQGEKQ